MLHLRSTAMVLLCSLLLFACKKKETTSTNTTPYQCTSCVRAPQALAANNSSAKGIYKGVMIGSTGLVLFDIGNAGSAFSAHLIVDGVDVPLTTTSTYTATQDFTGVFTGTLNGSAISVTFNVAANGANPTITSFSIPGHPNSTFLIYKETSAGLVECYNGTYHTTRPEDGIFNIVVQRANNSWYAIARPNGTTTTNTAGGSIVNGNGLMNANPATLMATINGDVVAGTFVDTDNRTITLSGQRQL